MTACWIEELPDDEIRARLVNRGVNEQYAAQIIDDREEDWAHDLIHEVCD